MSSWRREYLGMLEDGTAQQLGNQTTLAPGLCWTDHVPPAEAPPVKYRFNAEEQKQYDQQVKNRRLPKAAAARLEKQIADVLRRMEE